MAKQSGIFNRNGQLAGSLFGDRDDNDRSRLRRPSRRQNRTGRASFPASGSLCAAFAAGDAHGRHGAIAGPRRLVESGGFASGRLRSARADA